MSALDNIDQIITLYWEGDRSAVRQRYEQLFGRQEEADSTSTPASDENRADEPEEPRHRDTQPDEGDI